MRPRLVLLILGASLLACGRTTPIVVTRAPEPAAPEATVAPPGTSRFNPAPADSQVQIDNLTLSVTDVIFPADQAVRDGSLWNPTPAPEEDYVLVGIAATCGLQSESSCRLSGLEFTLVDPDGIGHNPRLLIAGIPDKFEGGEFFGGATKRGYLVFVIEGDPTSHVLKYESLFGGEAYLQIQ